jgi:hypothetical protein
VKQNKFYILNDKLVYVYGYKPYTNDEYMVSFKTEDGKEDWYKGTILDIREDFSDTDDSFSLDAKKSAVKTKKKTNYYQIVKFYDNTKKKGVVIKRDIFGKELAYALCTNLKKEKPKDILGVREQ